MSNQQILVHVNLVLVIKHWRAEQVARQRMFAVIKRGAFEVLKNFKFITFESFG